VTKAQWGGFESAASGRDIGPSFAPIAGEIVIDKPGKGSVLHYSLQDELDASSHHISSFTGVTTEAVSDDDREANDRG